MFSLAPSAVVEEKQARLVYLNNVLSISQQHVCVFCCCIKYLLWKDGILYLTFLKDMLFRILCACSAAGGWRLSSVQRSYLPIPRKWSVSWSLTLNGWVFEWFPHSEADHSMDQMTMVRIMQWCRKRLYDTKVCVQMRNKCLIYFQCIYRFNCD